MDAHGETLLRLVMAEGAAAPLNLLLQHGFMLQTRVGCSLDRFLKEQLGLSPEYIMENIQTIFLDSKPVDDLDKAIVKDGTHLALSAAMPGLVGAAMRRGGAYSSLRGTITYEEREGQGVSGQGIVHMKLFNLLMQDLGPRLLRKGIIVTGPDLSDFLTRQIDAFWMGLRGIFLEGRPVGKDLLLAQVMLLQSGSVRLVAETEEA